MSQIAKTAEVPAETVAVSPPLRVVTAASLFDGHDAAINLMRRLIQSQGCEVIHLGHNRSVAEIVRAAICEDADAIAVSSYQGGHTERSEERRVGKEGIDQVSNEQTETQA